MTSYRYIDDVEEAIKLGIASLNARRAHLHTLTVDGAIKPLIGATSALSIIGDKNSIMQWYSDMSALYALKCPPQDIQAEYEAVKAIKDGRERSKAMSALDKKYPDFCKARRAATSSRDDSADTGTNRHSLLEEYVKACIEGREGKPSLLEDSRWDSIKPFAVWAVQNVKRFIFTEAYCYNPDLWVGGIADLGFEMKDGKFLVGDHKSGKEAYSNQFLQPALYDLLLTSSGILDRNGKILGEWKPADGFVIFPFRSEPFTPEFKWNAEEWRTGAKQAVNLYKLLEITS